MPTTGEVSPEDAKLIATYLRELEDANRSEETINVRASYLRKAAREVGLVAGTEDEYREWLRRPQIKKPGTRATWISTLNSFYVWAQKRKKIVVNPVLDIPKPKIVRGKPRPVPHTELARAIEAADPRMRLWLLLGAMCGCRAREITFIAGEDLHLEDETPWLLITHGKGGKERSVALDVVVLEAFAALDLPEEGRLWPELTPAKMSRRLCDHLHKKAHSTSSGHALRHRAATDFLAASEWDLRLTQEFLGHSSPATTAVYAAADQRRNGGVVAKMGARYRVAKTDAEDAA